MRVLLALVLASLTTISAEAATVGVDAGNITLDGKPITTGGSDKDPALSPDGRQVVFTRVGKPSEAMRACLSEATLPASDISLWIVHADGSNARQLVAGRAGKKPEQALCDFSGKAFDSTGRLLYFDTPAWVTSGATHVVDLRTGRERLFIPGDLVEVLSTCKDPQYRDYIVATQHRYFAFGGSYDWAYLFDPAGKEVGPLGDADELSAVTDWCAGT